MLKNEQAVDKVMLGILNEQLASFACVVHRARVETLHALTPMATAIFSDLIGTHTELRANLKSGFGTQVERELDVLSASAEALTQSYISALESRYVVDRARRMTTLGPHRADLELLFNNQSAKQFASQGQQRAMILALKLSELRYLRERLGTGPILLLDDVSSELDAERTAKLFAAVAASESQTWVTSTGVVELPLPKNTQVFDVHSGAVSATS